jgi:hypothetical protein
MILYINRAVNWMTSRDTYIMVHESTKERLRQVGKQALGEESSGLPLGSIVRLMADDYLSGDAE